MPKAIVYNLKSNFRDSFENCSVNFVDQYMDFKGDFKTFYRENENLKI
jgi:hypothetical protein